MVRVSTVAPTAKRVVTLVYWVKGMGELSCVIYSEEEDVEVVGHWLRKIERVMNQMPIPKEVRVDYVTQLLIKSVYSWW